MKSIISKRVSLPSTVAVAGLALATFGVSPSWGADFDAKKYFSGKKITIVVGSRAGGAFDRTARIIAKVMGKHFPGNPKVVAQNRTGGGGRKALRAVMSGKPDGLSVNTINTVRFIAPSLAGNKVKGFDPNTAKWVGMPVYDHLPNAIGCRRDVVTSWDDALKLGRKLKVPAEDPTSAGRGAVGPRMIEMAGGPMKTIYGYDGGSAEYLAAMERGEVDCSSSANQRNVPKRRPEWIKKKFVVPVFWYGAPPSKSFLKAIGAPTPPGIKDIVKAPASRWKAFDAVMEFHRTSRAFVMHPKTPDAIYQVWKKSFKAAIMDPEYTKLMLGAGDNPAYGPPEAIPGVIKVVKGLDKKSFADFKVLVGQVKWDKKKKKKKK